VNETERTTVRSLRPEPTPEQAIASLHAMLARHLELDAEWRREDRAWKSRVEDRLRRLNNQDLYQLDTLRRSQWPSAAPMWVLVLLVAFIAGLIAYTVAERPARSPASAPADDAGDVAPPSYTPVRCRA
jgi:hypothetical protein